MFLNLEFSHMKVKPFKREFIKVRVKPWKLYESVVMYIRLGMTEYVYSYHWVV